jgi:hypothetical protein
MTLAVIFAVANLALWAFSFIFFLAYIKRKTSKENVLAELQDEIDKMKADIDFHTDRDSSLVEDRVKNLKTFLEDTDKRINLLFRETDRQRSQERTYAALGRQSSHTVRAAAPGLETGSGGPFPGETGQVPEDGPQGIFPGIVGAAEPISPKPLPLAEQVAGLYRAGFSPKLIADRLGVTQAEVDLAVALLESRGSSKA